MRVPERLRDRRRGPNRHRSLDRLLQPAASALGAGRQNARRGLCYRNPAGEFGGLKLAGPTLAKPLTYLRDRRQLLVRWSPQTYGEIYASYRLYWHTLRELFGGLPQTLRSVAVEILLSSAGTL